jgi:uncharacterized protein (DUF1778 family)
MNTSDQANHTHELEAFSLRVCEDTRALIDKAASIDHDAVDDFQSGLPTLVHDTDW